MSKQTTSDAPCGYTHIGGQALIEGVMMRGTNNWALSVRDARGDLHTEDYPLPAAEATPAWQKWPLVRGVVSLVSSLTLGIRALTISANLASIGTEEEAAPAVQDPTDVPGAPPASADEEAKALKDSEGQLSRGAMIAAILVALVMAVLLFIVAPAAITNFIVGPADRHVLLWNLVDGLLRVLAFFAYVLIIGRTPDIHRVFSYHGAEHKTIHCLEHGEELTPANAQKYSTQHIRCGTAFLLMVMVVAILIYTLVPIRFIAAQLGVTNRWLLLLLVIGIRLLFLPIIAGISYEITVKWAGRHEGNALVRAIMWPGLQMQRLTTAEPTDAMLEAAIAATKAVQAAEAAEATTA
ncbi:MAG: DUF1385 domain-containing protein [Coriobacteriia bacterium]|nr:DUF1385 domain-containing protein [Coriobacteriia bacterium]